MHLFYTPEINNALYTLSEEESKHCIRVLRLKMEDVIYLVDGKGGFFKTRIVDDHPKRCTVEVTESTREYGKRNHYLHVAVAPTKNLERLEWFLEKATEIGVDEITPFISSRSERKEVKTERMNKIVESAMKQSVKAYHPLINEPLSFNELLRKEHEGGKYIAHCIPGAKENLARNDSGKYLVLIGPEGDFTEAEVKLAIAQGFHPITLGESRLRTETAALQSCFEINYINR